MRRYFFKEKLRKNHHYGQQITYDAKVTTSLARGTKSTSNILGISRNTVKKYLQKFHYLGLSYDETLSVTDLELSELFQEKPLVPEPSDRYKELEALIPSYLKRLKRKGMTREILYKEYKASHPDGYARSTFNQYLRRMEQQLRPVMHLEHKAGDKVFIDFAGTKLSIVDRTTGEVIPVEVFVAILPCSQLTYVEAVMSQKKI